MITTRKINVEYLKILKSLWMFKHFNHQILNKLVIGEKTIGGEHASCYIFLVYLLYNIY